MKVYVASLFFLFISISLGCKKNEVVNNLAPGLIEGNTFRSTILIDGHEYDGTIIRNCIFENIDGDGLQIRDVNNLVIENCTFKSISGDAIRFRNSGVSDGVKILNNTIYDIGENGILSPEGHVNCFIKGNLIYKVAKDDLSSLVGAPHHGIYFQGYNVHITENTIYDVLNVDGNGISIRTYGKIDKNRIYNAADHGISYYSDHPGQGEELLIENNFIYDNGSRGIQLSSNGNSENHIGKAVIRLNSIVTNDKSCIGVDDDLLGVDLQINGNVLIRTDADDLFIFTGLAYQSSHNLLNSGDIGFVNFQQRDLHILPFSNAIGFATGLSNFPSTDIDGEERTGEQLDCGADELL